MNVQVYTTEEEQLQFLTNWLKKHGTKITIAVVLIFALVFGKQYWVSSQNTHVASASMLYEKMQNADEKELLNLANQLVKDYKSTVYGKIAAVHLANQLVTQSKWSEAADQYKAVYNNADSWPELKIIALENWLRAQIELKQFDAAVNNLNAAEKSGLAKSYPLNFYNLKGDLLYHQNKNQEAVAAYNTALDALNNNAGMAPQLTQFANLITLKRNDLLAASQLKAN